MPKIIAVPTGRLYVTWYDFHSNGVNADVYLRSSNPDATFPPPADISAYRITTMADSGGMVSAWLYVPQVNQLTFTHSVAGETMG